MRFKYLILPIITLIFTGCSSTYRLTDYKSKDEFYRDVNKQINNREVSITLNNDSTFATNDNGANVDQNYLSLLLYRNVIDTTISLKEVKNVDYSANFGNPTACIKLKNGEIINAENIRMSKEEIEFNTKVPYPYNIPISKLTKVSYKNTVEGIISGVLIGIGTGLLLTLSKIIPADIREGNPPYPKDYNYSGVGIPSISLGILVGGILGAIIGHHYNYEFR